MEFSSLSFFHPHFFITRPSILRTSMSMPSSPRLQSFRAAPRLMPVTIAAANVDNRGADPVLKVEARHDSRTNSYFILWRDIQTLYPKAEYVMDNDSALVSFMIGTDLEQLKPPRIPYHKDVVLNVTLPSAPSAYSVRSKPSTALKIPDDKDRKLPLPEADDPIEKAKHITPELSIADKDEKVPGTILTAVSATSSILPATLGISKNSDHNPTYLPVADPIEKARHTIADISIAGKDERIPNVVPTLEPLTSVAPSKPPAIPKISKNQDHNLHPPAVGPTKETKHVVTELDISDRDERARHPLPNILPLVSSSYFGMEDTRFMIPSIYPHTKSWFSARTPRLFILLPSATDVVARFCLPSHLRQSQDTKQPVSLNKLRLYFLCESFDGHFLPKHEHWVHLAHQSGSKIAQPTAFLEEFGAYILAIMDAVKKGVAASFNLGSFCTSAAKLAHELNKLEKDEINRCISRRTNVDIYTEDRVVAMLDETIAFLKNMSWKSPKTWRETGQLDKGSWKEGEGIWNHIEMSLKLYIPKSTAKPNLYGDLYKIISKDGYCQMVCQSHSHRQSDYDALQWMIGANVQGKNHFLNHLSLLSLDFSSAAQGPTLFKGLALVKTVSELNLSLNWNLNEVDLEGFTDAILQSSVVSLHLYATIPRGETVDATPPTMSARMNFPRAERRRNEHLLKMLAKGKLQRFLFRGLPGLFWCLDEEDYSDTDNQWPLLGGLSAFVWGKRKRVPMVMESFPTLLSADFRTLDLQYWVLEKFTVLQTLKMDFPSEATTGSTMLHHLLACPTLEEVEVYFSSTLTVPAQLLSDVDSVLKQAPLWKHFGRSRLRSYRSIAPDGHLHLDFVSEGGKEMSPRFSFSLYEKGYLQLVLNDILTKYGWAMKILNLSQSWESLKAKWLMSICDYQGKEGVWNIEELRLPRTPMDYSERLLLWEILERSPRLRSLTIPVAGPGCEWRHLKESRQDYLEWIITNMGLWLTDLWIFDCPEWHGYSTTELLLQKPILPKLTTLLVDFTKNPLRGYSWLVDVIASNQKYFSLVKASPIPPPSIPSMRTRSEYVEPLQNIALCGVQFESGLDPMKRLLEAIDFSAACSIVIVRSTFHEAHWNLLLSRLPQDGLLPDGLPVPLRSLTLKNTSLSVSLEDIRYKQEQLRKRAPLAELTLKETQ